MSGNRKNLSLPGIYTIRKAGHDRGTSRTHQTLSRSARLPGPSAGPSSSSTDAHLDSPSRDSSQEHEAKLTRTTSEHVSSSSRSIGRTENTRLPSINEVLRGVQSNSSALTRTQSMHRSSTRSNNNSPSLQQQERLKHSGKGRKRLYVCSRCTRTFTRKSDASKHERVVHDKVIESQCGLCNRQFTRKDYCYNVLLQTETHKIHSWSRAESKHVWVPQRQPTRRPPSQLTALSKDCQKRSDSSSRTRGSKLSNEWAAFLNEQSFSWETSIESISDEIRTTSLIIV